MEVVESVLLYVHRTRGLLGTATSTFTQLLNSVWRWGKRGIIYLSLHCHHRNDSCIKTVSDESRINVSLTVRVKVTRQCPQTSIIKKKKN